MEKLEYIHIMGKKFNKMIITVFVLLLTFSSMMLPASVVDLPIDIDAISEHGEERQYAITLIHQSDLFSETSQEVNEALIMRQERNLSRSRESLFAQPHELIIPDAYESLLQAATESRLFEAPFQVRSFTEPEEEAGTPIWVIIPVLAASAALGLLIAVTKTKRKEKHVHNNNS